MSERLGGGDKADTLYARGVRGTAHPYNYIGTYNM